MVYYFLSFTDAVVFDSVTTGYALYFFVFQKLFYLFPIDDSCQSMMLSMYFLLYSHWC